MLLGNVALTPLPLPVLDTLSSGILLFVKAPVPGRVKTRLGHAIGMEQSCRLYRCFGLDLLERLQTLNWPILIFFAPDDQKSVIQAWLGNERYYPQGPGNLGDRMRHAFETGFQLGFEQLLIFGSDSPDVPLSPLRQGMQSLQANQVVIGPSNDGGYYTLGFSQQSWCPRAFQNIQWSSEQVYPDTLHILRSHPHELDILPAWDDIDTLADLKTLYQRNLNQLHLPRTMAYLRQNLMRFL